MLLDIRDLNIVYRMRNKAIYAVNNVNFSLEKGKSLGIIGESGSGKSTLAMAILKMHNLKNTEVTGQIIFEGRDLLALDEKQFKEYRWTRIAAVFQKSMNNLSPVHKIGTHFEDIYRVHEPDISSSEIRERVYALFHMVNLSPRVYTCYPHELSGGMLQRVSIALSLIFHPTLLIMDESTTALDVITQGQILEEIKELEKVVDVTRIMITHDLFVVATACQQILVLYAGDMMEYGDVRDVLNHPMHPYTKALIASFPSLRGEKREVHSIPGTLPDLSVKTRGCAFYDRCRAHREICRQEKPVVCQTGGLHTVCCHLYGKIRETDVKEGVNR
ncbi:MAG TPA: ABC transporter ATP-binding protein [Bacillota bacterium]|nr:ABC transporter ATP-binding protein [Bacillota bacterium]